MSNPVLHDPLCARVASAQEIPGALRRGETLLLAASGGVSSTALVALCAALRESWRLTLHLGHVVTRPEARAVVEQLGRTFSIPLHEVRETKIPPPDTDQFAQLLNTVRARAGATRSALGDTEDRLLETFLSRIFAGAEPDALAGAREEATIARPLAVVRREECRVFLDRQHIPYDQDPSRLELRDGPSRMRLLLLPFLRHHVASDVATATTRLRSDLAEDAMFLIELSRLARADVRWTSRSGEVSFDVRRARSLPPPLQRRIFRDAIQTVVPDTALADTEFSRLFTASRSLEDGALPDVPEPLSIRRSGDTLLLRHL